MARKLKRFRFRKLPEEQLDRMHKALEDAFENCPHRPHTPEEEAEIREIDRVLFGIGDDDNE